MVVKVIKTTDCNTNECFDSVEHYQYVICDKFNFCFRISRRKTIKVIKYFLADKHAINVTRFDRIVLSGKRTRQRKTVFLWIRTVRTLLRHKKSWMSTAARFLLILLYDLQEFTRNRLRSTRPPPAIEFSTNSMPVTVARRPRTRRGERYDIIRNEFQTGYFSRLISVSGEIGLLSFPPAPPPPPRSYRV